jgi:hypothetical protein
MSDDQIFEDFEPDYQPDHDNVIVYPSEKRKRGRRRGGGCGCRLGCLFVPLAILACAALIGGLLYVIAFSAIETTHEFVDALSENDYVTAYEHISSNLQQQLAGPEGLRSYVEKALDNRDLASWKITTIRSFNIENNIGTFNWRVDLADGGAASMRMDMRKEGGEWKISYLEFWDISDS